MTNIESRATNFFRSFKEKLARIILGSLARTEAEFLCPVCDRGVRSFRPLPDHYYEMLDYYQFIHAYFQMETINRMHYACPHCGAADRDRLIILYFKREFSRLDSTHRYNFLDIAPAPALSRYLRRMPFLNYRSADISMRSVDLQLDIQDMSILPGESIDILLCSHVLEHVADDRQAVSELVRVMKTGGFGIIMVPILLSLKETYENKSAESEAERWRHFGQGDHRRLYSKTGFIYLLSQAGFSVKQFGSDYFGADRFHQCGIHPRSVLYVVEKPH